MRGERKDEHDGGRFELKYAIPTSWRERVLDLVAPYVRPDRHALILPDGTRGYEVHSLYYDTPELQDYHERLAERRVRNRLRVRTYGPRGVRRHPVFIENKRKLDNQVIKARTWLHGDSEAWVKAATREPWWELGQDLRGQSAYVLRSFHRLAAEGRRVPVSVVHYEREVFVGLDPDREKVRVTLDKEVRATTRGLGPAAMYEAADVHLIPPSWMVMELKFDGTAPAWMRDLCREMGLRAVPISKFGLSVALGVGGRRPMEVRYLTPRPIRRCMDWGAP